MFKKIKIFIILMLACFLFFFIQKEKAGEASLSTILISEIKYGDDGVADNEFIELYNATSQNIDITGYSLKKKTSSGSESGLISSAKFTGIIPANGFFLIAHPDYKNAINADLAYSGGSYYISSNNTIILYDKNDAIVDKAGYGSAGDFESAATTDPGNGKSIARKIINNLMQETDNNGVDFEINNAPSPQNISSAKLIPDNPAVNHPNNATTTEENNNPSSENNSAGQNIPPPSPGIIEKKYYLGDIIINELVSDPADGEEEWIELFNKTNAKIDLFGWTIEEGSGAKTNLTGEISESGDKIFFIVNKISGNLNNKGDIIILRDKKGNLIDQAAYGNWNDGNLSDNAPAADDPFSLARKFNSENSFNNKNDFAVTSTITKGRSNTITSSDETDNFGSLSLNYDYSKDIIISEIFSNPKGEDSENEFIELFNIGSKDVNLAGWIVENGSGGSYEITPLSPLYKGGFSDTPLQKGGEGGLIKAGEYFVVYRKDSKLVLNNSGGKASLFQPLKEKALQTVKYGKGSEGWSYNHIQDKKWQWSEIVTPGKANEIKGVNHAPVVEFDYPEKISAGEKIIFDSSDTYDEDGDKLNFLWDFGDGIKNNSSSPEYTFSRGGNFKVKLAVSDGKNEVKKEKIIKVFAANAASSSDIIKLSSGAASEKNIIINELLPNPEGADEEGEWIELFNKGTTGVNLLNWKLEDKSKKKFIFESDLFVNGGMFYVLERPDSGISLNNTSEAIRIYNDLGELTDEIEYEKTVSGESLARGTGGKLFWTSILTPGEENVISAVESKNNKTIKQKSNKTKSNNGVYVKTTLEKIKEFEAGDLVEVGGVVAVEPGIFGTQYFYIVGSPGIQVYNYKKDFPKLIIGDYIEARGELSVVNGEMRLKTKTAEDMKVIEHKNEPSPEAVSGDNLNEDYAGKLVKIAGEITEKKGGVIYLDDGLGEMVIQIKKNTGIEAGDYNEGEAIAVTGIASRSSSGLRILPRNKNDIFSENSMDVKVLGASSENDEWSLNAKNKRKRLLKYLLVASAGVILVLGGVLYRKFRKV